MANESAYIAITVPIYETMPFAIASFSLACSILLFNIIIFRTLKVCDNDLSASTALLMRCQLIGNCIGMTSIVLIHKVWFTGRHFAQNPYLDGLPGAIGAVGIYTQSSLLLFMGIVL